MTAYEQLKGELSHNSRSWLVTGVAGFIGSNILETLLKLGQTVRGLDNFATGHQKNLDEVKSLVSRSQWANFVLIKGDIQSLDTCQEACRGMDYVLHQAALGSVPRSVEDPLTSHNANITGCLNMFLAARDRKVKRLVYASSSSIYGDHPDLPKVEDRIGRPLSPYALTKLVNELYAEVFARCYKLETIGLRYFNVFGARQDPEGPYAAVIPKWIAALLKGQAIHINGDGETSRDFCYVDNVVQANLLAATRTDCNAANCVYNIALNEKTTLNELFVLLRDSLVASNPELRNARPIYQDFRPGDVRHSQADITRAKQLLGFAPTHQIAHGIRAALSWYQQNVV